MPNVLVVADDDCIRLTCAEVLATCGFPAATEAPTGRGPDVVLMWEPSPPELAQARLRYGDAAFVICAWGRAAVPPGATAIPLPFNAQRVSAAVTVAARRSLRAAA